MLCLVLTGTTGFPLLEEHILRLADQNRDLEFILQSPNTLGERPNVQVIKFLDLDSLEVHALDAIVGHCGAGTVFWALERRLPLIAIVDLVRLDTHQEDLGDWVRNKNLGLVLVNRGPTREELITLPEQSYNRYEPTPFSINKILKMMG